MNRTVSTFLDNWLISPSHKPLIMRGARQVGKTWLVRNLAKCHSRKLVELNLEKRPELAVHFASNDPRRIISDLEADLGVDIRLETSILFLDEIQAVPALLASLRWFWEELPELPVIAAGSLLDFTLREHDFSMPVGRITFCHVEPLSFFELLDASGNEKLHAALSAAGETGFLSLRLHQRSLELFSEYCMVGGMPEVVEEWIEHRNDDRRLQLQRDLVATYRDDFNKYKDRVPPDMLRRVMDAVPRQLGNRFVYSHVNVEASHRDIKRAIELLTLARVCHRVEHTAANGLPLGAESNPLLFKIIMADIGLSSVQLGLSRLDFRDLAKTVWANKGGLAEQFVGQHLRCLFQAWEDPCLFYWQQTGGRQGEIDYVLQQGRHILPVEVKAGSAGSMKSLHAFMQRKQLPLAVRLDANPPSVQDLDIRTTTGEQVRYRLLSLPLYMTESLPSAIQRCLAIEGKP
ncbi:MAG: AAA family ATPase [bacterium]|nr:AAA family ATPase [bacterium]